MKAGAKKPAKKVVAKKATPPKRVTAKPAAPDNARKQLEAVSAVMKALADPAVDINHVADMIVKATVRLAGSETAGFYRRDAEGWIFAAGYGATPFKKGDRLKVGSSTIWGRAALGRRRFHYADTRSARPKLTDAARRRTRLAVPIVLGRESIAVLAMSRADPGGFDKPTIALIETFADQLAIAMTNTRLLTETKASLTQQTATADVLRAISRSAFDLNTILRTLAVRAAEVCGADNATLSQIDGGMRSNVASSTEVQLDPTPAPIPPWSGLGRMLKTRRSVQVLDIREDRFYEAQRAKDLATMPKEIAKTRTLLVVPLRRDQLVIGAFLLRRNRVQEFNDSDIKLVETFADQAVIAIENVRLFNETKEALERQTAIGDILRVISGSVTDIRPVLDAIAASAARFTMAADASVLLMEGDQAMTSAHFGPLLMPPSVSVERGWVAGRAILERRTIQVEDATLAGDEYPRSRDAALKGDHRTVLAAPLVRDGKPLGAIILRRREPQLFSDRQVELVQTFADQAAIAIANVRLFNETKESLERQTATAELLNVISQSTSDLGPVFETIVRTMVRLCAADVATFWRPQGDGFVVTAGIFPDPAIEAMLRSRVVRLERGSITGRVALERGVVHLPDVFADPEIEYGGRPLPGFSRSALGVPILRGDNVVGIIVIGRNELKPFSDAEIALVQTFADQALIAIENVRLFNETGEALERQMAIGDILKVISASPTDIQPVLDAIAESAARFAGAEDVTVMIVQGDQAVASAHAGPIDIATSTPIDSQTVTGRAIVERRTIHTADVRATDEYPLSKAISLRTDGQRAILSAPLMRDGRALGAIVLRRREPLAFSDRQIELVQTFADQAVIALANTRLFKETQEALERQTATAELLAAMSQSAFDLKPVFEMVLDKSVTLCRAEYGWIRQTDREGSGTIVASRRPEAAGRFVGPSTPIPETVSVMGRAYRERRTIHVHDITADPTVADSKGMIAIGARTGLGVPLLRGDEVLGVIILVRIEVRPFTDREIELVESFARQAAIAIENVRLFNEIQEKSAQLEVANRHKSVFLANMSHELRTPLNAIIGFSEVLIQKMFGELNEQQADYLEDIRSSGTHLLSLINDILDLSKIEAGKMELELSSFSIVAALDNAITLIRERASSHGIRLEVEVAPPLDTVVADERKLKQVMVNLLTNAVKFTPDRGTVSVRAARERDAITVAVHDTGIGIAPEDQQRIFEEFTQASHQGDRSREGTGLGLSLTKRIVELHGGTITVESAPGGGSTFTVSLPLLKEA